MRSRALELATEFQHLARRVSPQSRSVFHEMALRYTAVAAGLDARGGLGMNLGMWALSGD